MAHTMMEDLLATVKTNSTRLNEHSSGSEDNEDISIVFNSFLGTPNLIGVKQELSGRKTDPLSTLVAPYPTCTKDPILEYPTRMLDVDRTKDGDSVEAPVLN